MRPGTCAVLVALLAAACATSSAPVPDRPAPAMELPRAERTPGPSPGAAAPERSPGGDRAGNDLAGRLAARAGSVVGTRAGFTFGDERFTPDCSGFVAWVYHSEGIPLRRLMERAAPRERSAVAATYAAARAWGVVFGGGGEWPQPGDLVFFRDTYDRNRDGRFDDPFTHMGVVERVDEDGTVSFIHRGSRGVARGAMSVSRPAERRDENGRELNSILRKGKLGPDGATLAGRLFMGYARFDPERLPVEAVALR